MSEPGPPSIPAPVGAVVDALASGGHQVALVGGCLRDTLRRAAVRDFDLTTDARSATVLALFPRAVPIGRDTVMIPTEAGPVDVTPFHGNRLHDDLGRRDFTVNAIAWDVAAAQWIDPFEGRADLASRILRPVGSLRERLAEDPLRALRAARFVATLDLDPSPGLAAEIVECAPSLRRVAPERIRRELERLILGVRASAGLAFLRESGIEACIAPLRPDRDARDWIDRLPARLDIRFAAWLSGSDPQVTLGPLRVGERRIAAIARRAARHPIDEKSALVPGRLRHLLARASADVVLDLVLMREAELGAPLSDLRALLDEILSEDGPPLVRKALALDGRRVMQTLDLPPGRRVGDAIRYLMERVLDDPSLNTEDGLRECLEQWRGENL